MLGRYIQLSGEIIDSFLSHVAGLEVRVEGGQRRVHSLALPLCPSKPLYVCVCVCVCVYVCMYVYTYIHPYMYIYIHTYILIYSYIFIYT